MRVTILYVAMITTLGVVTTRVHYVHSGSFMSNRVRVSESETGAPVYSHYPRRVENVTI